MIEMLVDSREKADLKGIAELYGFRVTSLNGDIAIRDTDIDPHNELILVEHKRAMDWVNSCTTFTKQQIGGKTVNIRKIEGQILRMKDSCLVPMVIVTGNVDAAVLQIKQYTKMEIPMLQILAVKAGLFTKYHVHFEWFETISEMLDYVTLVFEDVKGGKWGTDPLPKYHKSKASILSQMPGISLNTAYGVIRKFGSVEKFVNATQEELEMVPGIGKVKAAEIYRWLRS